MSSKARMTFRFDNQEQKPAVIDLAASPPSGMNNGQNNKERTEIPIMKDGQGAARLEQDGLEAEERPAVAMDSWTSPVVQAPARESESSPQKLEQLIRNAGQAANERTVPADAYVELGELSKEQQAPRVQGGLASGRVAGFSRSRPIIIDMDQDKPSAHRVRHSDKSPSWFKAGASVVLAIATGALFGYFILSLFTSYTDDPSVSGGLESRTVPPVASITDAADASGTAAMPQDDSTAADSAVTTTKVQVNVPASEYYMLQFGVFSNEEGKQTALSQLDQVSAAAAASTGDKFHVYAGMAKSKSEAEALSAQLEGLEIYITKVTVPALGAVSFAGDGALLEQFLLDTDTAIAALNQAVVGQLLQTEPGKIGEASYQSAYQQWTRSVSQLQPSLSAKDKDAVNQLAQSMQSIISAIAQYNKNPSRSYLLAAQSELMEAVLEQKEWIGSILTL